jgi:5-methylcytosine-specific restriction endonuclease McrA
MDIEDQNLENKELGDLFKLANKVGGNRYHRLTSQDFDDYRKFDYWRYINGDGECGTTEESKIWVRNNSEYHCPVCESRYTYSSGRSIDHKLPRSQYPWLSMEFKNLWVICWDCNQEKGEMHWYQYEHHMLTYHSNLYSNIVSERPIQLLKSLKE